MKAKEKRQRKKRHKAAWRRRLLKTSVLATKLGFILY